MPALHKHSLEQALPPVFFIEGQAGFQEVPSVFCNMNSEAPGQFLAIKISPNLSPGSVGGVYINQRGKQLS